MEEVVWSLSPKNDSLSSLISRIEDAAADLCFQNNIYLEFSSDLTEQTRTISESERKNVYLIFKEFLNNSIKHAEPSKIELSFKKNNNKLIMKISDDGKGFDIESIKNKSFGGNGLNNFKKRAELINAEMYFESKPGKGTTIEIKLAQMSHSIK